MACQVCYNLYLSTGGQRELHNAVLPLSEIIDITISATSGL